MEQVKIQYFRLREDWQKFRGGTVLCAVFDGERFRVSMDSHWSTTLSPDEMAEIAGEVDEAEFQKALAVVHADNTLGFSGEIRESVAGLLGGEDVNPERALATTSKFGQFRNAALVLSKKADTIKSLVEHNSRVLQQYAGAMRDKLEIERKNMEKQMAGVKSQLEMLQHALHMANLYLGSGEIVSPIREGKRADANEPLSIRQRVLFMDEECAMLDEDGIDAYKVSSFDEYIQNPALLDLVLPEQKGIVVLKVARKPRKYEGVDPFTQMALDQENAKTYWLIRNGEALWRFWADFDTPHKLFPDRIQEVSMNRPGSAEYYQEMEVESNLDRLPYMKAGLLVQGIIDRTLVFAPFPDDGRPSLTNPDSWNGHVNFIYDDQRVLGEGRMPFQTWLRGVNKRLLPGQRIVTSGNLDPGEKGELVHPKGACGYNENCVWTVCNDKRGLFFRFPRKEYYGGDKGRSGSYILEEGGSTYINFDAAPLPDFEYYLRSREARIDYRDMVPVLRRCQELKTEEIAAEAPFRALLRDFLLNAGCEESRVDAELNGLILWWKGKNRDFRPLVGDEKHNNAAFTAIMEQFGRVSKADASLGDIPLESRENLVLAIQRNDKTVVAYFSAHPDYPTYFTEQVWSLKKGGWQKTGTREWVSMPSASRVHPRQLFADKAKFVAKPVKDATFVPKPTLDALAATPLIEQPFLAKSLEYFNDNNIVPLAIVAVFEYGKMQVGFVTGNKDGDLRSRGIEYVAGKWQYGDGYDGAPCILTDTAADGDLAPGMEMADKWRKVYIAAVAEPRIQRAFRARKAKVEANQQARREKQLFISHVDDMLEKFFSDAWRDEQYRSYLSQGGDATLFEDHLRTIKTPQFNTHDLRAVLAELLIHSKWAIDDVRGAKFDDLFKASAKLNASRKKDFFDHSVFPESLVIPDGFAMPERTKELEE